MVEWWGEERTDPLETKNAQPDLRGGESLNLSRCVRVPAHVLVCELDGEAVLLNTDSGHYFGMDEVGTRMWSLLAEHGRVEPVYRTLLEEYDVGEAELQHDLLGWIEELVAHQLLETVEGEQDAAPAA